MELIPVLELDYSVNYVRQVQDPRTQFLLLLVSSHHSVHPVDSHSCRHHHPSSARVTLSITYIIVNRGRTISGLALACHSRGLLAYYYGM